MDDLLSPIQQYGTLINSLSHVNGQSTINGLTTPILHKFKHLYTINGPCVFIHDHASIQASHINISIAFTHSCHTSYGGGSTQGGEP